MVKADEKLQNKNRFDKITEQFIKIACVYPYNKNIYLQINTSKSYRTYWITF